MSEYDNRISEFAKFIIEMPEKDRFTTICSVLKCYDKVVKEQSKNIDWDKNKPFWEMPMFGRSFDGD